MNASRRWVIALFTVAFLLARLTGAHLHLCLDGSEPPAQLHVSDSATVDHHHTLGHSVPAGEPLGESLSQSHDDVDVDALGSVVSKVSKLDLPVIALIAWCLAFLYVAFVRQTVPGAVRQPRHPPPRYLRPLLRAPPV